MIDDAVGGLFVCEDYTLETFKFKEDVEQELYCLKSAVTDFDLTGQIVWPAAVALANYIIEHKEVFAGKNIIELGAGAGLSGFVAAKVANKVVLTDFMEVVMKLLHKNAQYLKKDNVFVGEISWGEESLKDINIENSFGKKFSKEDKIDIVMGADVIFWPESIDGLVITLNEALEINKDCLVLISFVSRVNHTNTNLDSKMEKLGLKKEIIFNEGDQYIFRVTK